MRVCAYACGDWTWTERGFVASNAPGSVITIRSFSADSVIIDRKDANGSTGVYTGKFTADGGSITGTITFSFPGHAGYPNTTAFTAVWNRQPKTSDEKPNPPIKDRGQPVNGVPDPANSTLRAVVNKTGRQDGAIAQGITAGKYRANPEGPFWVDAKTGERVITSLRRKYEVYFRYAEPALEKALADGVTSNPAMFAQAMTAIRERAIPMLEDIWTDAGARNDLSQGMLNDTLEVASSRMKERMDAGKIDAAATEARAFFVPKPRPYTPPVDAPYKAPTVRPDQPAPAVPSHPMIALLPGYYVPQGEPADKWPDDSKSLYRVTVQGNEVTIISIQRVWSPPAQHGRFPQTPPKDFRPKEIIMFHGIYTSNPFNGDAGGLHKPAMTIVSSEKFLWGTEGISSAYFKRLNDSVQRVP